MALICVMTFDSNGVHYAIMLPGTGIPPIPNQQRSIVPCTCYFSCTECMFVCYVIQSLVKIAWSFTSLLFCSNWLGQQAATSDHEKALHSWQITFTHLASGDFVC